jgi:protein-L-isoaspartate(D-aspartate) O-methyltransferase
MPSISAGAGYYTAIIAELVGAKGRVTGIEFEPELAARARANLARYPNTTIVQGDGASVPFDPADVIYVNAGATQPAARWLDALKDGGRLILPLTTEEGFGPIDYAKIARRGAVFRIERRGNDYLAKWIAPVAIFPCAGNRDPVAERALAAALERGRMQEVTRLYRGTELPEKRIWLRGEGWCVAFG